MKPVRTTRPEANRIESDADSPRETQVGVQRPASGAAGRNKPRTALLGPAAGWRLPSGQLLVEYALQTCFTGSPFNRPPFQAGPGELDRPDGSPAENEIRLTEGLGQLHTAVTREGAPLPAASGRKPAVASRADSGAAKAGSVKARSRS